MKVFKSIAVHLDQGTHNELANEFGPLSPTPYAGPNVQLLNPKQYLEHYINSLTPYFNSKGETIQGGAGPYTK